MSVVHGVRPVGRIAIRPYKKHANISFKSASGGEGLFHAKLSFSGGHIHQRRRAAKLPANDLETGQSG